MPKTWQIDNLFYKISLNLSSENNKFNLISSYNSISYIDISNNIPYLFNYYLTPDNLISYTRHSLNNIQYINLDTE